MDVYIERQASVDLKIMAYSNNPLDVPLTMSYCTNEKNVNVFFIPDTLNNQMRINNIIVSNSNVNIIIVIVDNVTHQILNFNQQYDLKINTLFNKVLAVFRKSFKGENFSHDLVNCLF
jgi:hypothetical protein